MAFEVGEALPRAEDVPVGFQSLTVSTTVVGLDYPDLADVATFQVLTNPVRLRVDGGAPAAAIGHSLAAGDWFELEGRPSIHGARFIREGAADATVVVTYFLRPRPVIG